MNINPEIIEQIFSDCDIPLEELNLSEEELRVLDEQISKVRVFSTRSIEL